MRPAPRTRNGDLCYSFLKKFSFQINAGLEPITYEDIEEPNISAEEKSRRCWVFYLNKDSSIITDIFLGQFRSTLRCSECQHESVTFEPYWVVSLPLSKVRIEMPYLGTSGPRGILNFKIPHPGVQRGMGYMIYRVIQGKL